MKRLLFILFAPFTVTYGQTVAVKSDLLYDLTCTTLQQIEIY